MASSAFRFFECLLLLSFCSGIGATFRETTPSPSHGVGWTYVFVVLAGIAVATAVGNRDIGAAFQAASAIIAP